MLNAHPATLLDCLNTVACSQKQCNAIASPNKTKQLGIKGHNILGLILLVLTTNRYSIAHGGSISKFIEAYCSLKLLEIYQILNNVVFIYQHYYFEISKSFTDNPRFSQKRKINYNTYT